MKLRFDMAERRVSEGVWVERVCVGVALRESAARAVVRERVLAVRRKKGGARSLNLSTFRHHAPVKIPPRHQEEATDTKKTQI